MDALVDLWMSVIYYVIALAIVTIEVLGLSSLPVWKALDVLRPSLGIWAGGFILGIRGLYWHQRN